MNIRRTALRANELSRLIDAATERPDALIEEFNDLIARLRAARADIVELVRAPRNW